MPDSPPINPDNLSFQGVAEQAPIMIWMAGLDLGCFYFNQAWLRYRGRSLAEESGNQWAEGVHPDDLPQCVAHYTNCFAQRTPFAMNYRLRHFSGKYFWVLDRGTPNYTADGTFVGFFGGCAETVALTPAELNSQLRTGLAGIATFARELAQNQPVAANLGSAPSFPLKEFAQKLQRAHAAAQIGKLAQDILAYGDLPHGSYLK